MKTYAEQFASWANSLDVKSLDEDLVKNFKFLLKVLNIGAQPLPLGRSDE